MTQIMIKFGHYYHILFVDCDNTVHFTLMLLQTSPHETHEICIVGLCVMSLQNRENGAILLLPWDAHKLQGFQLQEGFAP